RLPDAIEVNLLLRFSAHLAQKFSVTNNRRKRVVQLMRHARDELANSGQFFTLNQLRLRLAQGLQGLLQLRARAVQVVHHAVERVRQLSALVVRKDGHAAGKIATTHRLGAVAQLHQRMHAPPDQQQHDRAADEEATDADRNQQRARATESGERLAVGGQQHVAHALPEPVAAKLCRECQVVAVVEVELLHARLGSGGKQRSDRVEFMAISREKYIHNGVTIFVPERSYRPCMRVYVLQSL